ncbi:integrase arm-type DNA-binding domain-containing protein [Polynucleobacter sp. MWH-Mekk-B1]|nr:integrase arm-type DNA-binding domain-containing protein [Polynucleobacter finlandensis]
MLTDPLCKSALCPADKKRHRLYDAENLYLEVLPSGNKSWFWKYWFEGKEKRAAIGSYSKVSLKNARIERDRLKQQHQAGQDPNSIKKLLKQTRSLPDDPTFSTVALAWYKNKEAGWSIEHAKRTLRQMERDLFPVLGTRPIKELTGLEILQALKKVEERGAIETADRGLMICRQVYDFVALDQIPDVTRGIKAKLQTYRGKNFPAITDPKRFSELLKAIDLYHGGIVVKTALKLAPILFQRPQNLRTMRWSQIDFDEQLWTIPASEMKRTLEGKENGQSHYVPLPTQAIKLLNELKPYIGNSEYVFRGERQASKPISDNSVRSALYSLGFGESQSWHGFRASARTMLAEQLNEPIEHLEAQLAHAVKDANGTSYNRAIYIKQRGPIMQRWADYLDELKGK